jgi:hypothetical protein
MRSIRNREYRGIFDRPWINEKREQRKAQRLEEGQRHSAYFGRVDHNERKQADKNEEGQQPDELTSQKCGLIV